MVNARASKVVDEDETTQESPPKPKKRRARMQRSKRKTKEHVMTKINMYLNDSSSEEDDGTRKFNLNEKLTCERYSPENNSKLIIEKLASEITLEYFQRNDFETPILIKENTNNGLGLKMPASDFWVDDVKDLVGPRRMLDVMDVETQEAETMKMKDWATYFKRSDRDRLLNVISLEFSHTKLDALVDSPRFVKKMDWVDLVWPRHLKKQQKEGTNALQEMKYPKVQKYCLMGMEGSWTDFHLDFGGTSVWYHILRGGKVFWLIPPTERNLRLYEEWTLSGKQGHIFFGDTVEECVRVNLRSGNTFLIPTGWIHAVYTTEDSMVFGGNFLHGLGSEMQLKVDQVEKNLKVGQKFRYPFFNQLMWYVIIRYVHCLTGKNYLCHDDEGKSLLPEDKENGNGVKKEEDIKTESEEKAQEVKNSYDTETEDEEEEKIMEIQRKYEEAEIKRKMKLKSDRSKYPTKPYITFTPNSHVHLCQKELRGLGVLINWLDKLPPTKKCIPEQLISPEGLLRDARQMLEDHKNDDPELAVTGDTCLFWITKDFLKSVNSKPKRTYVKKAKPVLVEGNENGTVPKSFVENHVPKQFSNLSSSMMSQEANNQKFSAGTTLKMIPKGLQNLIAATDVNNQNMASTSASVAPAVIPVQTAPGMSLVRPIPIAPIAVPMVAPVVAQHAPYAQHYGSQPHNPQLPPSNHYANGHVVATPGVAYAQVRQNVQQPTIVAHRPPQQQMNTGYVHQPNTILVQQQMVRAPVMVQAGGTVMPVVQVPIRTGATQVQVASTPMPVVAHPVQRAYYRAQYAGYQPSYVQQNGQTGYYHPGVQAQAQPQTSQPQVLQQHQQHHQQQHQQASQPQYSYPVQTVQPAQVHAYAAYQQPHSQSQPTQYQPAQTYYYAHTQQAYPQTNVQYSNGHSPAGAAPPPQSPNQPPPSPSQPPPPTPPQHVQPQHHMIHQQHQMYQYNPNYNYHY